MGTNSFGAQMRDISKILLFGILMAGMAACALQSMKKQSDNAIDARGKTYVKSGFSNAVIPFIIGNVFYSSTYEDGTSVCKSPNTRHVKHAQQNNWSLDIFLVTCSNLLSEDHELQDKIMNTFSSYYFKAKTSISILMLDQLPAYTLALYIMPNNVYIDKSSFSISFSGIEHEFYVQMPDFDENVEQRIKLWSAESMASILHEYFHAVQDIKGFEYPNTASEEAAAYVFDRYLSAQFLQSGKTTYQFTKNGKELSFDPGKSVAPILQDKTDENPVVDSVLGREWALRSILHIIGSSTLDFGDSSQRRKLFELCSFMIHKKPDITEPQDLSWIAGMTTVEQSEVAN